MFSLCWFVRAAYGTRGVFEKLSDFSLCCLLDAVFARFFAIGKNRRTQASGLITPTPVTSTNLSLPCLSTTQRTNELNEDIEFSSTFQLRHHARRRAKSTVGRFLFIEVRSICMPRKTTSFLKLPENKLCQDLHCLDGWIV